MTGPTIRTVLFGADPRAAVPKGGWDALRHTLSHVRAGMRPVVEREFATAVANLLNVDVSDALLAGWLVHTELRAAARATAHHPEAAEIVTLATHQVGSTYVPHVDLVVNGVKVATVEVTVELAVEVDGLLATVRGGRLTTLHSGRCRAKAALLLADVELLGNTVEFEAPVAVPLGHGVDLLGRDTRRPVG